MGVRVGVHSECVLCRDKNSGYDFIQIVRECVYTRMLFSVEITEYSFLLQRQECEERRE